MKQVLLSGILAISSIVYAQAQNDYSPLLQTDATWRFGTLVCGIFVTDFQVSQASTSIDGQFYRIIANVEPLPFPEDDAYYYIREDVTTRRVYRYSMVLQTEVLIYDFSLEAGDTFDLVVEQWDSSAVTYPHIIDAVGQVQLEDGTWRKQIFLTRQATPEDPSTYSYSWIEGIGCASLNAFEYVPYEWTSALLCYKLKEQTLWNEAFFDTNYCEDLPEVGLDVDDNETPTNAENIIQASPNPSSNFWTIAASNEFIPQNTLHLYSIDGRRVKSYNWEGLSVIIDNSDLEAGMYLLQCVNAYDGKMSMLRLIKQ